MSCHAVPCLPNRFTPDPLTTYLPDLTCDSGCLNNSSALAFYPLVARFPRRCTSSLATGEGLSGVMVALLATVQNAGRSLVESGSHHPSLSQPVKPVHYSDRVHQDQYGLAVDRLTVLVCLFVVCVVGGLCFFFVSVVVCRGFGAAFFGVGLHAGGVGRVHRLGRRLPAHTRVSVTH
jgi:hypothetical protein